MCWDFGRGKCNRGDQCRFAHTVASNGSSSAASASPKMQLQQFEIAQIGGASTGHRVIMDSGASFHFTPRREFVRNISLLEKPIPVAAAFGEPALATLGGDGFIPFGRVASGQDYILRAPA